MKTKEFQSENISCILDSKMQTILDGRSEQ